MSDDTCLCTTFVCFWLYPTICLLVNFKGMILKEFFISNVWEFLKHLIFQMVAPIKVLFIPLLLEFDGLHNDIKMFVVQRLYWKVIKKLQPQTQRECTIVNDL